MKRINCDFDNLLVFRLDKQLFNSEKDVLKLCEYIYFSVTELECWGSDQV